MPFSPLAKQSSMVSSPLPAPLKPVIKINILSIGSELLISLIEKVSKTKISYVSNGVGRDQLIEM